LEEKNNSLAQPSTQGSSSRVFWWLAIATIVGTMAIHAYLTNVHYGLKFGQEAGPAICTVNDKFNCEAVSASSYSEFAGIPLAMWGGFTNFALLLLVGLYPFAGFEKKASARQAILALASFIAFMSIVMGSISTFALSTYCLFCIAAYVFSFFTLGFLFKALPIDKADSTAQPSSILKTLALTSIGILAGSFIANDGIQRSYGSDEMRQLTIQSIGDWKTNPKVTITPIEPLLLGASPENAKMTIVEYADFRCMHCRHAAPILHSFVLSHPNARLIFQAWPLDGECNTAVNQTNGVSCALARAVVCANRSGKGWAAHSWIFEHQELFGPKESLDDQLPKMSETVGLAWPELQKCMNSDEVKSIIEKTAAQGTALKIQGTPTIYVNDHLLPAGQVLPVLKAAYSEADQNPK
jgi:protein-disulfide isomerase